MKNIADFTRKPELVEIILDDEAVIKEFDEPVVFYMKDYIDVNTYFDFYRSQTDNSNELNIILRKLILNKDGEPVIKEGETLPITLAVNALAKINETLGKSRTKPSAN